MLNSLLLLKFLLTCIMINLKSRNLIGILCHYHFEPIDSISVNARNPQPDPRIHPSDSDVILNMSWILTNQIAIDCNPKSIQLIYP